MFQHAAAGGVSELVLVVLWALDDKGNAGISTEITLRDCCTTSLLSVGLSERNGTCGVLLEAGFFDDEGLGFLDAVLRILIQMLSPVGKQTKSVLF